MKSKKTLIKVIKMDNYKKQQPTQATLYMTKVCNFFCEGCSRQTVGVKNFKELDVEIVQKTLEQYPTLQGFCLAGLGEPTLNQNLPSIIEYLKENGKYAGVITNGSNVEPFRQMKHQPDYISISLYGYNKEQYNDYVKLDMYDTVIENYKKLKEINNSVGFSYFVCKENIDHLEKIVELANELEADFLNITNYLVYDTNDQKELDKIIYASDTEYIEKIEKILAKSDKINARPIYLEEDYCFHCPSYRNIINIDGDGSIGGCQRQIQPSKEYGNILTDDDPYNSGEMETLQSLIDNAEYPHGDNCKYCFGKMNPYRNVLLDIGVYILFYEKVEQTIECIKSFLPFDIPIYVLNNGSSKNSRDELGEFSKKYHNIKIIDSEVNLGVGVGRNKMIHETNHQWMFFVDNDITVNTYDFLFKLDAKIKELPEIEAFLPKLYNVHDDNYLIPPQMIIEDHNVRIDRSSGDFSNMFPGGAAIINRNLFERLGHYDLQMFVGLEDFEMALRALILQDEIRSYHINSIELIHDHREAVNVEDKKAVLERYNFDKLDKSYYRILEKYPEVNFKLEFRPWVVDQIDKMLGSNVDLKFLNSKYSFGSLKSNQAPVIENINYHNIFEKTLNKDFTFDLMFSYHHNGCANLSKQYVKSIFLDNKKEHEWYIDYTDYNALHKFKTKHIDNKHITKILVSGVLEFVENIRPFIRFLRTLLQENQELEIVYLNNDKLNQIAVNNNMSYFYWDDDNIKKLLVSSGIIVENLDGAIKNEVSLYKVSSSKDSYELFLKTNFLPSNNKLMVITQEHARAKITGGIGSYVQELEDIFNSEISVLMVAAEALYPERSISMELRHIVPSLFFNDGEYGYEVAPRVLKECVDIAVFLYDNLKVIEMQDVNGKAYKVLQASKVGLYPNDVTFKTLCHASRISLENLFQNWIDYKETELIEEKFVIENADKLIFPTKYLMNFYDENGYEVDKSKVSYCRLPFKYGGNEAVLEYKEIDTLIFFGKRQEYKGYGLFADMVKILLKNDIFTNKINKIILLGPKSDKFQEYNDFFDSLQLHNIEVEEVSLKRSEALELINNYSNRAICYTPYIADNHPNTVLEVVNNECLLLASKAGGIPELVPYQYHNDILFDLTKYSMANLTVKWLNSSIDERVNLIKKVKIDMVNEQININKDIKNRFYDLLEYNKGKSEENHFLGITLLFNASNYNDIEQVLKTIHTQVVKPDEIICFYNGEDTEKMIQIFSEIKIVVWETAIQSVIRKNTIIVFLEKEMKINQYFIYKLLNVLNTTKSDGVIFNSKDKDQNENEYLADGVFYFSIKNIVGHPYGAFRVESIINLENLNFDSIWNNWSFITNFVSSKRDLLIYPTNDIEMEHKTISNFKDEMKVAKSIKTLSYFEMLRANASLYQLKEFEAKYISLKVKNDG
jgi:MoaA/NifB/PqqE/SkfB family radical SAM enzyme/GT2 family glycosyltransferase